MHSRSRVRFSKHLLRSTSWLDRTLASDQRCQMHRPTVSTAEDEDTTAPPSLCPRSHFSSSPSASTLTQTYNSGYTQNSMQARMYAEVRDGKCVASSSSSNNDLIPAAASAPGSCSLRAQFVETISAASSSSQEAGLDRLQSMLNGLISRHLLRPTDLRSLRWLEHARIASGGNELRLGFDSDSSCASFVAAVRYREGVQVKIGDDQAAAAGDGSAAASPFSLGVSAAQATAAGPTGNGQKQYSGSKLNLIAGNGGRSILQLEASSGGANGAHSQQQQAPSNGVLSHAPPPFSFSSPSPRSRLLFPFRTPLEPGLLLDGDRLVSIASDCDDESAVSFRVVVTLPLHGGGLTPTPSCSPLFELQRVIERLATSNVLRRRCWSWLAPVSDAFCSTGMVAGYRRYVLQINPSSGWSVRGMLAIATRNHVQIKPFFEWYLLHARSKLTSLSDVCVHSIQTLGGDADNVNQDKHIRQCGHSHDPDRRLSLIRAAIRLQEEECEALRQAKSKAGGKAQQPRRRSQERDRRDRSDSKDRGNHRDHLLRRRTPSDRPRPRLRSRSPRETPRRGTRSRSRSRPRSDERRVYARNGSSGIGSRGRNRSRSRPRARSRSPKPRSPPRRRSSRSRTRSRSRQRDRPARWRSPSPKRGNGYHSSSRERTRGGHRSPERSRSRNRSVERERAKSPHKQPPAAAVPTPVQAASAAATAAAAPPSFARAPTASSSSPSLSSGVGLSWLYPAGAVCVGSDLSVGEVVTANPTTELSVASLSTQSLMVGLPCAYLTDNNGNAMSAADLAPWQRAADAHACLQALRFTYRILDERTPLLFVHRVPHRDQYGFDFRLFFRSEEACKLATARVEGRAL